MGKERLLDSIAREEARLAAIEQEREYARGRLATLRGELTKASSLLPVVVGEPAALRVSEKITLFRSLFRGRDDVFPKLWTNPKGKKGYAPACKNEWIRGVCEKPKVKCGECLNQAFLPVTDQVLLDHLQGRHVIGVYPLLRDETCWFLVADFDKKSWTDDVAAFVETCRRAGVQPAVERSRAGNGAHVWIFFAAPIAAGTARQMGCYFITETMARRHQLCMASYDRFFPNQDTMPRGGFGNLIALPLQHAPRQEGNTVFLNADMVPYPEQWAYLAAVRRHDPDLVETIATEALQKGRVIGVRMSPTDEEEGAPWKQPPSRRPPKV